jgi:single-strand DNA-binding protein
MNDLNQVTIEGRLTRDPELSYTPAGTAVCKLSLAVNRSYKKDDEWKEEVSYVDVTAWAKTAEAVCNRLHKGNGAVVSGYLKQERWEKDGQKHSRMGVVADRVIFLPERKNEEEGA